MAADNKVKQETQSKGTLDAVEAETQDEIDQIMNEIEELQKEMNTVTTAATSKVEETDPEPSPIEVKPAAPVSSIAVAKATRSTSSPAPLPTPAKEKEAVTEPSISTAPETDQEILKEFSGEGDEPWLEETLSHLKPDTSEENNGILGQEDVPTEPQEVKSMSMVDRDLSEDTSESGTLAMTVKGNISIRLDSENSGQSLLISFRDGVVRIQMSDGAELKIPLKKSSSSVKAA